MTPAAKEKRGKIQASSGPYFYRDTRECPSWGTAREIVIVGGKNVGLLAGAMASEAGSRDAIEFIYGMDATVADAFNYASEYEEKALPVPRKYTLHAGVHDVL